MQNQDPYANNNFQGQGFNQPYQNQQGFNQPPQQYNQQGFNQPPQQYNQQGFNQPPQQQYQPVKTSEQQYQVQVDEELTNQSKLLGEDQDTNLFGNSRLGFIRKVYMILFTMLMFPVLLSIIAYNSVGFQDFLYFQSGGWILLCFTSFFQLFICIAIFCSPNLAKKVPANYILCYSFAACLGYMVAFICGQFAYEQDGGAVVVIAASLTLCVTIGLTVYAMTTKKDFTMMGGLLFCLLFNMIGLGLFMWIFGTTYFLNTLYCVMGVMLYSVYLIFDTQLIVGGKHKKFQLDYDHYILGAMMLFIDIIQLFLYILQLLSRR